MLFVISGPSGVGKGTLIQRILTANPSICLAVSATTRKPRPGETNGVDYYFLDQNQFDEQIRNHHFLNGAMCMAIAMEHYCLEVTEKLKTHRAMIIEIDVQGAEKIRQNHQFRQCHIFIAPPSEEILENRLKSRNTDHDDAIQRRLLEAKRIVKKDQYDQVIVNNELTQSTNELNNVILSILTKESSK